MAEVGEETPLEVQSAQVQTEAPNKESFFARLKKRVLGSTTPSQENQPGYQGKGLSGTRTTEQIQEQVGQPPTVPEQPQETVPAPGDPGYEPITNESPVPAPEREARLRYAAQQYQAEQNNPTSTTPATQEPELDTSRPEWQSREDQRLVKGYEKEAIRQSPQTPRTGVPTEQAPTAYESPFSTSEQAVAQASTPQADTSFAEKVLETPAPGEHEEVEGFLQTKPAAAPETTPRATTQTQPAAEGPGQTTQAPVPSRPRIEVVETSSEDQPIPIQIPQEEEVPT